MPLPAVTKLVALEKQILGIENQRLLGGIALAHKFRQQGQILKTGLVPGIDLQEENPVAMILRSVDIGGQDLLIQFRIGKWAIINVDPGEYGIIKGTGFELTSVKK